MFAFVASVLCMVLTIAYVVYSGGVAVGIDAAFRSRATLRMEWKAIRCDIVDTRRDSTLVSNDGTDAVQSASVCFVLVRCGDIELLAASVLDVFGHATTTPDRCSGNTSLFTESIPVLRNTRAFNASFSALIPFDSTSEVEPYDRLRSVIGSLPGNSVEKANVLGYAALGFLLAAVFACALVALTIACDESNRCRLFAARIERAVRPADQHVAQLPQSVLPHRGSIPVAFKR